MVSPAPTCRSTSAAVNLSKTRIRSKCEMWALSSNTRAWVPSSSFRLCSAAMLNAALCGESPTE
eukprot:365126-Chlamydomonas_euryale.AAC.54